LFLTTGRLLGHYQSRTQTRHVAELEDGAPEPLAEMHPATARLLGLSNGRPVTLTTRRAAGTFMLKVTPTVREDTVFVPFHWGDLQSVNRLTSPALDPISRMPEFKVCAVRASSPASHGE
jgi:assimilatory nitrate reductase catalytic subunit